MSRYNPPYQPSGGSRGRFEGGQWSNQYHNGQWQLRQNCANDPSVECNNYKNCGTYDGASNQGYSNNYALQTGWDERYPQQDNNNYPQRGEFYSRDGGHYHKRPKLEPVEGNWNEHISRNQNQQNYNHHQGNYDRQPYHTQIKEEVEEDRDRNHRSHHNQQNQSTDHTESCHQPMLNNLLQHVRTQRPYWQSRHKVKDVWYSKVPCDNRNNHNRNHPNIPTKTKVTAVARSSRVPQNSIVDKTKPGDNVLQQKRVSIENNHNKANNTSKAVQRKSTPSLSNANLQVPKMIIQTIQETTTNAKGWSIKNPVGANQQSSTKQTSKPSRSSRTNTAENSCSSESNNMNQTNSDQSVPSTSSELISKFKACLRHIRPKKPQFDYNKTNVVVHASTLYAQDRELESAASVRSNNPSLPDLDTNLSASSTEVHNNATLESAGAHLEEKVDKPGPLFSKVQSSNVEVSSSSKVDEPGPLSFQLTKLPSSSPVNKIVTNIAEDANSDSELSDNNDDVSSHTCPKGSVAACTNINDDLYLSSESDNKSIQIEDSIAGDTDYNVAIESSGDEEYGLFSPSSEKSNLSAKRTIEVEDLFTLSPKRPKIVPEKAKSKCLLDEDIIEILHVSPAAKNTYLETIVISDDENMEKTVESPSTMEYISSPIVESKNETSVPALSKTINSNPQKKKKRKKSDQAVDTHESKVRKVMDKSKNQEVPSVKSTRKVTPNSKEKTKPKSPIKKSAPMSVKKASQVTKLSVKKTLQTPQLSVKKSLPTSKLLVKKASPTSSLPSQQEGKLRHIVNKKIPVVLLDRLTTAEILKFSASKTTVDKSCRQELSEADLLKQMQYFISVVYYHSTKAAYKVSLASEVNDPKDLCNRVLHISTENSSALMKIKYLQENSDHHRITYKTLSNPEFDIKKMYKEFIDFRKSSSKLDLFTICTNFELSLEAFKNNGVIVTKDVKGRYKFSVEDNHELHKKFLKCLTLPSLAEVLVQCINQKKMKNFNTELIKKYHLALVKENIFAVHTKKSLNAKQVAKFHLDFINQEGVSNAAKELYHHLSVTHLIEPTASMELAITNDQFGKDCNLDPNPQVEYKKVADALVNQEPHELLSVKSDLEKIVGHVLQKEEGSTFSIHKQFFIGQNLPGNLKTLRRQIQTLLGYAQKDFRDFCNSKITIQDFCNDHPVQKLPDENSKKLFEEFFNCFTFEKIEKYSHVLDEDFLEINSKNCMYTVQRDLLEKIKMQNLGEESLASIKNLISKCKVTSMLCQQLQPQMDIVFDKKVLETLRAKVPEHDIVLCVSKSVLLTNLKVKQLCTNTFKFQEGKESLFITNKTLLEMTSDVLKALAHSSTNLLVIQWTEPEKNKSQVTNAIFDLKNLTRNHRSSMKSVIVILDQKHSSSISNLIPTKITDNQHSFDLSEASKAKLLQADNISLQHRRISLKPHLLADEHVPSLLESPEILRQLLTGKLSLGKELARPCGYKDKHFKPQIKRCIVVDPKIFHEDIEDVFIIRNVDRKDLEQYLPARQRVLSPNDVPASMRIPARFILLGFNVPPSFFEGYAEKNHDHNVHLLRYKSGSFVWEKTQGNNKDLLRNRLEATEDLYKSQPTEEVVESGPKTVIICGESGSGKSVCLYELARKTRYLYKTTKSNEAFWPVQVNLDKSRLSRFAKRSSNVAFERDFVPRFLCDYLELDETQSKLLTMIFHDQLKIKLVLLFDSYESLPSSHRDFVVKLLQELQVSYCERVYVTSTPSTRSELEKALAVFAYSLEFSEVEKIQFLQSFWSKRCGDVDLTHEAAGFIENYGSDFTNTPLRLRMLAAMYDPQDDEEHVEVETREELYKLYVEHKGVKDEASASLFSLRNILDAEQLKSLHLEHAKKGFAMLDDLRHRTFYEYFAAKYLATKNHSVQCIDELLDSTSPLFLETYLAREDTTKVIGDFAASGHLNVVRTMLARCETKLQLTTVIRSENPNAREVVRFLLDHYNDTKDEIITHGEFKKPQYAESSVVKYVNRREKPKKETPLEVAARLKNVPIACELLLKGANIKGIDKEFVAEIAKYIADEMCKKTDDSSWLHPIAEKLFKLQPDAVAHLDKTKELPRLLSYFFTHGRVELVNLLLKNDRERYNILEAKVGEKSMLDFVNESRVLGDDERLEIAKYIVTNVGEDLERRNRYYLADVLNTAAECNHERTFEYFIGKYPERHTGFLESAMRSNRLDLIRFLMRKTDRMMYPEDNTALHKAVSLGVSPMTINFLVNRGGIDNKNKAGETPLCVAFKEGQELDLVEYLIKKDAHLFAKDELGLYPWCHAILDESKYTSEEQTSIMKWLQEKVKLQAPGTEQKISFESDRKRKEVARKLKFFQKTQIPNLELHMALKCNDESWIRFLILRGANVDHKEDDGRTPLHVAVEFKRYKLAKMLLDRGAMFNVKDKNKATPLKLLSKSGDESKEAKEMKELLELATELFNGNEKFSASMSRHLINCRDKDGRTLLHVAAKSGNKAAVREIIKQSRDHCITSKDFPALDINAKDSKGNTPLNLVKSDDVAKELLINGAIFEPATTPLLQSAEKLIQAVKDKDVDRLRRELARNEYLANARDKSGKSCLHWAASHDSREIMELVLAVRASDVDAVDLDLKTPLHFAVENDNIASVLLLLKAGASYDAKEKEGRRPFDVDDKANESVKLLRKLHEMFVDIKSDEPRILANENPDALVEYLAEIEKTWSVAKDVVVNIVDCKKNTLLHTATRYDFGSVVENLLKQGAIYNCKNKLKKSPEMMAICTRQLFKSLARCQQKLNVRDWVNLDPELVVKFRYNSGYTLLYDCANQGKKEEVRWLIENGADVKATSNRGTTVSCSREKYPAVFAMLEEM